jgi:DNA replication and repair protein RecF
MNRGVESLELSSFRSYETFILSAELKPIVLTGPNGVGKTNLLEALSFLIPGRGLRRAKLRDVRQQSHVNPWAVSYHLNDGEGVLHIGTGQDPENPDRRLVKINGEKARSQGSLAEWVSMVWLTPQMDRLFLEGPQGRRRFLDRLVYGLDPVHAQRLSRYEHALK